jgi:hypothetical protein
MVLSGVSGLRCLKLNSDQHTTGRSLPANGTSAIAEPTTYLCKFNFGHYGTGRLLPATKLLFAFASSTLVIMGPVVCLMQTEPRLQRSQLIAFASSTLVITGPVVCLMQTEPRLQRSQLLAFAIQLQSSRDRSFASCKRSLRLRPST